MDEHPIEQQEYDASHEQRRWEQLLAEVKAGESLVSDQDLSRLLEKLETADFSAFRAGILMAVRETLRRRKPAESNDAAGSAKRGGEVEPRPRRLLGPFLLEPLLDPSLVFYTLGENRDVRDEPAMILLGQRVSLNDFPNAKLQQIRMDVDAWQGFTVDEKFNCTAFMGRVGLFGDHAVEQFVAAPFRDHKVRFKFRKDQRDPEMKQNDFSNDYYCLDEYEQGILVETYRTEMVEKKSADDPPTRVDYAIVQRFVVRHGTREMIVLLIAGLSSLGTYGATVWLAKQLFANDDIWVPDGASKKSKCEVLLEVTADETGTPWTPRDIVVRSLYLDDKVWSMEEKKWLGSGSGLTIYTRKDEPHTVLLDGKPVKFNKNADGEPSQRLLFFVAAARTADEDGKVDLEAVVGDPRLRVKGMRPTIKDVRIQLNRVRESGRMNEAIQIDDKGVRFLVKVEVVEHGTDAGGGMTYRRHPK